MLWTLHYCRYAIRGTPHRSTLQWVAALDTMLSLHPAILVPQVSRAEPESWGDVLPLLSTPSLYTGRSWSGRQ